MSARITSGSSTMGNDTNDIKAAMSMDNFVEPASASAEPNSPPATPSTTTADLGAQLDIAVKADDDGQVTDAAAGPPTPASLITSVEQEEVAQDAVMAGIDNDATPAAHANDNDNGDEGVGDGNDDTRAANITPAVNITPVLDDGRQFRCMNDEFSPCQTGQYTMNLSRKVISNHFGRNKACTRLVKDWPLFCRKHYQRATYKPQLWQRRKVNLILRQFDIIEEQLKETLKEQFKGITYNVHLKKAEEARLNEFSRKVANGISYETAAEAVAANTKVKSFQAPIKVLRELENFLGDGKDLETCQEAMKVILDMLSKGETSEVPSIEFLPNIPPEAATVSRINAKGGIQRPRCT